MYGFPRGLVDARLLNRIIQQSIRRFHCLGQMPGLFIVLMHWAISQMRSRNLLFIHCVVKPPLSYQISIVSAVHWLTPTHAISAQMWTCRVGIWIELASVITDFANQKAAHYRIGSQRWSIVERWISNAHFCIPTSGVLNFLSRLTRCCSRGEEGVLKVL